MLTRMTTTTKQEAEAETKQGVTNEKTILNLGPVQITRLAHVV